MRVLVFLRHTGNFSHYVMLMRPFFQIASTLQLCAGCRVSSRGGALHAAPAEGRLRRGAGHPHLADGSGQFR